ncbi:hypothetical protein HDU76_013828 [Blyttiomyces sp. JEL0837]|nr:hypothetical protein HDU76_013828 [Blyttiomyces sp. JEL0837]
MNPATSTADSTGESITTTAPATDASIVDHNTISTQSTSATDASIVDHNTISTQSTSTPSSSTTPQTRRTCRYFSSKKGCRLGTECPFEHVAGTPATTGDSESATGDIVDNDIHERSGSTSTAAATVQIPVTTTATAKSDNKANRQGKRESKGDRGKGTVQEVSTAPNTNADSTLVETTTNPTVTTDNNDKVKVVPRCKFFSTSKGCRLGDSCKFSHPEGVAANVDKSASATETTSNETESVDANATLAATGKRRNNNRKPSGVAGTTNANDTPSKSDSTTSATATTNESPEERVLREMHLLEAANAGSSESKRGGRGGSGGSARGGRGGKNGRKGNEVETVTWGPDGIPIGPNGLPLGPPPNIRKPPPQRGQKKSKVNKVPKYLQEEEAAAAAASSATTTDGLDPAGGPGLSQSQQKSSPSPRKKEKKKPVSAAANVNNTSSSSSTNPATETMIPEAVVAAEQRSKSLRPPVSRPAVTKPSPKTSQAASPIELEIRTLERRFRSTSFKIVNPPGTDEQVHVASSSSTTGQQQRSSANPAIVEFALPPSDPDFPYELEFLQVRLILPSVNSPESGCRIKVLNSEIPGPLARNIERGWDRKVLAGSGVAPGAGCLLALVNWLDRFLEKLLSGVESIGNITLVRNQSDGVAGSTGAGDGIVSQQQLLSQSPPTQTLSQPGGFMGVGIVGAPVTEFYQRERLDGDRAGFKDRVFYYGVPNDGNGDGDDSDSDGSTGSGFFEEDENGELVSRSSTIRSYASSERTESVLNGAALEEVGGEFDDEEEEDALDSDDDGNDDDGNGVNLDDVDLDFMEAFSAGDAMKNAGGSGSGTAAGKSSASTSDSTLSAHRGTQVRVPDVVLKNVSLLRCLSPYLIIRCSRCKNTFDSPALLPDTEYHPNCPTCGTVVGIRYRAGMVHSSSKGVGYLDLNMGTAVDLLPSPWEVTCGGCARVQAPIGGLKRVSKGVETGVGCMGCHTRMSIIVNEVRFIRLVPSTVPSVETTLKKKKPKEDGIVLGQSLPRNGACSHYKKSYRWFRFPCCGKVYPCDICHEEKKSDGHSMEWATRMICGFCSREQPYSQKPCSCGKELTRKNGSGFWEGGLGTRSKTLMNRNDTRKFKGTNKTVSMKINRVGTKGVK